MKGATNEGEEEEEDDTNRDPNIIREDRKKHKEELNFEQVRNSLHNSIHFIER